jgi:transcriptional regulator with XRE-family HTH domain
MYQRIRDLREDADLSQQEVAQALHCAQQSYSNYELGNRSIPLGLLIQLADFYHTTTDYLLGRTNFRGIPEEFQRK